MTNAEAIERASKLCIKYDRVNVPPRDLLHNMAEYLKDMVIRLEQAEKEKAEWREEAISMAVTASEIAEDHGEIATVADLDQAIAEFKERT